MITIIRPAVNRWGESRFIWAAMFATNVAIGLVCAGCGGRSPTAPVQNAAPAVTVVFQGASTCTLQGAPCALQVVAQASDPDGDPLQYSWSGCANGTSAQATCTVQAVGAVTAAVVVSDGHGHTVSASAAGEGLAIPNAPPTVSVAFQSASTCTPQPAVPCVIDVIATATDPDGDPLTYRWSGCAAGTAPKAPCRIEGVGRVVASVDVTDGHGHNVSGSVSGEGLPDRPSSRLGVSARCFGPFRPGDYASPGCVVIVQEATDPTSTGVAAFADLRMFGGRAEHGLPECPACGAPPRTFGMDLHVPADMTPGIKTFPVWATDAQGRRGDATASIEILAR
jgi:hypothetical protein